MEKLNRENPKESNTPPLNNIQRIKQEPSSGVCYVCGCSTLADCKLYFKPFSNGPFFPFLEHHLPPNGSEHPGPYGDVQACSSCYSKLLKQWDVYERSGTPHHKRQYWLKGRAFGGPHPPPASMDPQPSSLTYSSHFQVFYPLKKEILSSGTVGPSNPPLVSSYSHTPTFGADQSIKESSLCDSSLRPPPSVVGSDALDLSIPSSRSSGNFHVTTQFLLSSSCYVCGEEVPENKLVSIYAKSLPNSPYFPFLITHPKPPKARPMDPSGKVLSCESCSKSLVHQWAKFQRHNVPIPDRCYKVRDWSNPTITSSSSFQQSDKFYCFTCGSEYPIAAQRIVYSKPGSHGNYFSFLETLVPPQNALPLGHDGKALVCSVCYKSFQRQLQVYELSGVPEGKRTYKVFNQNDNDINMLRQHLSNANSKNIIGCYLCGNVPISSDSLAYVDSTQNEMGKMFFHFLKEHQPSAMSRPMDNLGRVLVCSSCYATLKNQWNAWESAQIPYATRHFTSNKIKDLSMPNNVDLAASKSPSMQFSQQQQPPPSFLCPGTGCYICGRMMSSDKTLTLSSVPKDNEMYFPFLKEYISPPSSRAIDENGKVLVCTRCYHSLKRQWDAYEASHVPTSQRQYSIESDDKEETKDLKKCSTSSALHIQVYSPDMVPGRPFENNEPLLTTVPTHNPVNLLTTQAPTSYVTTDNTTLSSKFKSNFDGGATHQIKIQDPFDQMIPSIPLPISTTCYVCGENSSMGFTYLLNSYPPNSTNNHESDKKLQNVAFFPFIGKLSPPNGAQPRTEDGKVLVCVFCYHSLLAQWLAYEHSPHPDDRNCWARKYNTVQYICYICGITTYRVRVRSLAVCDFPFLLEHPRPPGALTVHGGERVVVCLTCNDSFTAQWNEYDRLKLPLSMRKYNWIVLPPPNAPSPTPKEATIVQKSSSTPDKGQEESQAVAGGKLLPSSMAGGPGGRSMAAVSPLAYDSRTSSFAAALRKLARQAGDPALDKDLAPRVASPASSSKRPPPPPLYQSSGGAPIVTIAPTRPIIHSSSQDSRKAIDLSTLSHHSDHHEAKQHPADKWEETSAPHIRPGSSLRSEALSPRGFQPYGGGGSGAEVSGPSLPHHLASSSSPYESPLPPGYSYHHHHPPPGSSAFLPPSLHPSHHFPSHYRMEDPLFVEKYGMLRSPAVLPYHQPQGPPSLLSHPPSFYYRYGSEAILAERIKLEEEHQRSWEERSRVSETNKYNSSQQHPNSSPPPLTSRHSPLPSKKHHNGPLNLATSMHPSDSWSPWRPHPRSSLPAMQESDIRRGDTHDSMPDVANKTQDVSHDHKPQLEMVNGFYMRPSPPPLWEKESTNSRRLIAAEGRRRDNIRMPSDQTFETSQPHFRDHRTSVVRSLLENHPPIPPPPSRLKTLVPALVSKLDLEEEKLRKHASLYPHHELENEYESGGEEEEEEGTEDEKMTMKHFLIISKGPPLPLEMSPEKKEFMGCLGLVTYKTKIDEEFKGLLKKKYMALLERYPSPTLELENDPKEERSSPLPSPSPLLSEQLSREPLQHQKSSFLSFLDLKPVDPSLKLAYQQILISIQEEKARRNAARRKHKHKSFLSRLLLHPETNPLLPSSSKRVSEEPTEKPLKRKLEGMPNGLIAPISTSSATDSPPYLTKKLLLSASSTPPPPPLSSFTSTPEKACLTPPAGLPSNSASVPVPPRVWLSVPQRHRHPASRKVVLASDAPQDPQTRQFAQKFHESVFLTTQQQLAQKQQQQVQAAPHTATPTPVVPEPPANKSPAFKWPGIEMLLEAYEHHLAEQRLEKEVLVERCQVLQSENHSLKTECEGLSHRMAELLQKKQATDEERAGLQASIDALKQTLLHLQPR